MAVTLPYPQPDPALEEFTAFQLLQNLKYLASVIASVQSGQLVPVGAIIFVKSGSTCPAGYTKLGAPYTTRFLRIDSTAGTTGASSVSVPTSTTTVQSGAGASVASSTHLHTITPIFVGMIACEKT